MHTYSLLLIVFFTILSTHARFDLLEIHDRRINEATARLILKSNMGKTNFCTGTLISKNIILTARHCVENSSKIDVILGKGEQAVLYQVNRIETMDMPNRINNMYDQFGRLSKSYSEDRDATVRKDIVALYLTTNAKFNPVKLFPLPLRNNLSQIRLMTGGYPGRSMGWVEKSPYGYIPRNVGNLGSCYFSENTDFEKEMALESDCIITVGNSGGPIYTYLDGELYLVATNSVSSSRNGKGENFLGPNDAFAQHVNLCQTNIRAWIDHLIK